MFEDEEGGNAWVVTFADMMTLILVFFILLYTLADFEDESYKKLVESSGELLEGDSTRIYSGTTSCESLGRSLGQAF